MTIITTPTTASTAPTSVELTTEQRERLEVIASTYPTQDDLIVATAVFFEHKMDDTGVKQVNNTAPMFIIGADKSNCLTKDKMDALVAMYATNDKLLALMQKVEEMKPVTVAKAKQGSGCAYVARNLD